MISIKKRLKPLTFLFLCLLVSLVVSACGGRPSTAQPNPAAAGETPAGASPQPAAVATEPILPTETAVPTPTFTPEPLALKVNGEGVSLVEYQASLKQLQEANQAQGKTVTAEEERQLALDDLTNTALLAQAAYENGFALDEAALQAEVDKIAQQRGGEAALRDWYSFYGYTDAAFRATLKRSLAAAWQRDQIAASVPQEAEQIHARQILLREQTTAESVLRRVTVAGADFEAYAYGYDPIIGGDLGWFPRGYLLQPEVEEAAFALQPGGISGVVKSAIGYHIVQVIAREGRPLSPDARRALQHKALQEWLNLRKASSQVEILL